MTETAAAPPFDPPAIARFVEQGYLRLDSAFSAESAAAARAILWQDLGSVPAPPALWPRPSVRLGYYDQEPFIAALNAPRLRGALDQLCGVDRWRLPRQLGSFLVRLPSAVDDSSEDHWHVDMSFAGSGWIPSRPDDYSGWRVNWHSRGRLLTLLMLFSDVSESDAPTRLRVGSHRAMARLLLPAGEAGLHAQQLGEVASDSPIATATGPAGTVYLCHPFLIHAGQRVRGSRPRFLAQPSVVPAEPVSLMRSDGAYSPVEAAIRTALGPAAFGPESSFSA